MLQLHILNSGGTLDAYCDQIVAIAEATFKQIQGLLPVAQVDVVIYDNPKFTIPSLGIGGYSPSAHTLFISLDAQHPELRDRLPVELPPGLAHELHHCIRWHNPGYGTSLLDALVTEGLAQHFEKEFRAGQPPYYATVLEPEQLVVLTAKAESEFCNTAYDHQKWFFGSADGEIPFYTGYAIGYELVKKGLERLQISAAAACSFPTSVFIEGGL